MYVACESTSKSCFDQNINESRYRINVIASQEPFTANHAELRPRSPTILKVVQKIHHLNGVHRFAYENPPLIPYRIWRRRRSKGAPAIARTLCRCTSRKWTGTPFWASLTEAASKVSNYWKAGRWGQHCVTADVHMVSGRHVHACCDRHKTCPTTGLGAKTFSMEGLQYVAHKRRRLRCTTCNRDR